VLDLIDLLGQRDDCARSLLIALQQLVAGSAPAAEFLAWKRCLAGGSHRSAVDAL